MCHPRGSRWCLAAVAWLAAHAALAAGSAAGAGPAAPAAPAAPAVPSTPSAAHYAAWRSSTAQLLAGHGDARSLATAAALSFFGPSRVKGDPVSNRSAAVEFATRASELAPEDAGIGWLRLQLCAATAGCDIRDPATTMRWVDADNSAVWMATLAAAQRDRDPEEVSRILQDMAQGSRFDVYRNRTVVLLFETLKKVEHELPPGYVPSDLSRLSEALSVAGAEVVPPYAPLLAACRETADAERRESCLKLAKIMRHADAVASQMAGLTLEKRLSAPDSKEWRAAAERRRILEWRVSAASEYDAPALPWLANALARARVREMRATPREEDVDIAILRKHKIPLEPPG